MSRWVRVTAAVLVAGVLGVLGAGAALADAPTPLPSDAGYPTEPGKLAQAGKWDYPYIDIQSPVTGFDDYPGARAIAIDEPQFATSSVPGFLGTSVKITFAVLMSKRGDGYWYSFGYKMGVLCQPKGAFSPTFYGTGYGATARSVAGGPAFVDHVDVSANVVDLCSVSQGDFVGIRVEVSRAGNIYSMTGMSWQVATWQVGAESKDYPSSPQFCSATKAADVKVWDQVSGFGPCGAVGGGVGGGGVFDDPDDGPHNGDTIEGACPDPPHADWLSFDWLGPWIGYYAKCLTVPKDGLMLQPVYEATQKTAYGDVFNVYRDIRQNVKYPGNKCGSIMDGSLPGLGNSHVNLSTCNAPFNQFGAVRAVLAIGAVVFACYNALFLIFRFLGFNVPDQSSGDDK